VPYSIGKQGLKSMSKVDILAIGVHPDDIELSASGTLLKHKDLGYSFGLCDLSMGQLGSRGDAPTRIKEAEAAKTILGAEWRINLGMEDGFFRHDEAHIRSIIRVIRYSKAEIVLANAISDRHPDHGRAAKLVADACFYAGLLKIETEWEGKAQEKHRPRAVYHYVQDRNIKADFVVDVSSYMDKKMESILAYKTQFFTGEHKGPETPISGKYFMDYMYAKNKAYGRDIGADYAEAFTVNRDIGVQNLFDLQ
jgi:bacillithiol biosynthesis deacetylase BshB1